MKTSGFLTFQFTLSSLSPLFVLWLILRNPVPFNRFWFDIICMAMITIPNGVILLRWRIQTHHNNRTQITVTQFDDKSPDVIAYLLMLFFPFYTFQLDTLPRFSAVAAAFVSVVILLWRLEMYYMNLWFAIFNYRIYKVHGRQDANTFDRSQPYTVISRRRFIVPGDQIEVVRLSDSIVIERQ